MTDEVRGSIRVTVPNVVTMGQIVAETWQVLDFQNGGRPPSLFQKSTF